MKIILKGPLEGQASYKQIANESILHTQKSQMSKHKTVSDTSAHRRNNNSLCGIDIILHLFHCALLGLGRGGLLLAILRGDLRTLEAVAEGINLLAEGVGDPMRILASGGLRHGGEVEA